MSRAVSPDKAAAMLKRGDSARVHTDVPARFEAGDRVVTRNMNPAGHTRLPRYARAREGVVDRDHGVFIFPDTHAANGSTKPQHCYSVRFTAETLWGEPARARESVFIDLFEDYLEPAAPRPGDRPSHANPRGLG